VVRLEGEDGGGLGRTRTRIYSQPASVYACGPKKTSG
jgi:hypothetical protein